MSEFDIIRKYFAPLSSDGLINDGAVLQIPEGHELVVSSDTLNAGTHFLEGTSPSDIAHKALRVNLSDLASMGANPLAYQLNIAFPEKPDEEWLSVFTRALQEDQKRYGIICSGGDTTFIKGALSISITALGTVPKGKAVGRKGAHARDIIALSAPIGDAWLGLKVLQEGWDFEGAQECIKAYQSPQPAMNMLESLRMYAQAAIDVSDGLIADVGHIASESGVNAVIRVDDIPLSRAAQNAMKAGFCTLEDLLSGGDDYVLAFAILPSAVSQIEGIHVIGEFQKAKEKPKVLLIGQDGKVLNLICKGWQHF